MVAELTTSTHNPLADLQFRYPLRRYQREILDLVKTKLAAGDRQLHIVAPPGAGKTIIGLQIIAELNKEGNCPGLILSPNTTIQSQWGEKLNLFQKPELEEFGTTHLLGTHEDKPLKPITLLTYQVLSTVGSEQEYLEKLAHQSWLDEMTKSLSLSSGEAELRILELLQNNRSAYQKEMSRHVSRLRRKLTDVIDINDVLHKNAIDLVQSLRRQKFGLVIFDECHHLTDYWAAVMTHLVKRLHNPVVIGLTGTPPEGKSSNQETRYLSLVGEIDYQVPTPALVKERGLAPFQDLVFFTEPTENETVFLEGQHEEFHLLLTELTTGTKVDGKEIPSALSQWILHRVQGSGKNAWEKLLERDPELGQAAARYIWKNRLPLPDGMDLNETLTQSPLIDDWMVLLEDYALHYLKTSSNSRDHNLYERIKEAVRKLGYGLTERGIRRQASPVDRVLAYSQGKSKAAGQILEVEYRSLGDRLRAAVVTDFERMAATGKTLKGVLDAESGGAIAVMRELLRSWVGQFVNPCLVTGSLVLVDNRIAEQFVEAAQEYIAEKGYKFKLNVEQSAENFTEISAGSSDWETRLYVGMVTEIFERGITKCLIGTRGIFGEGWDSQSLNTLLDLTTSTSPVAVKQLRGRSIRMQTNDPLSARKVANNWDVVCIAPHLEKGLNDYQRFVRKHDGYYGIADDGHIECGVGHVHASLSELTPVEVFASLDKFNQEMIRRCLVRDKIYDLWKIGQPYLNRSLGCVEVSCLRKLALTPPHIRRDLKYKIHAGQLRASLNGIWWEYSLLGGALSATALIVLATTGSVLTPALLPYFCALWLGCRKHHAYYKRLQKEVCQPNTQESSLVDIAKAVLSSLQELKILPHHINKGCIKVSQRIDGSYRLFLDEVETEQSQYFAKSLQEVMAPITNQPYLIPKYEYSLPQDDAVTESKFFKSYLRGRAEPRIAAYHAVPKLLARTEKGREAFETAWNKYVSPGFIVATETKPELLERYFGMGPSLSRRLLWE